MNKDDILFLKSILEMEFNELRFLIDNSNRIYNERHMYNENELIISLALGAILHNYYTIIENIIIRIMKLSGESLPQGENWHKDLILKASIDIEGFRVKIISKDTLKEIDKLRGFRHIFRNVYGQHLDYQRILYLIEQSPKIIDKFNKDVIRFTGIMEKTI